MSEKLDAQALDQESLEGAAGGKGPIKSIANMDDDQIVTLFADSDAKGLTVDDFTGKPWKNEWKFGTVSQQWHSGDSWNKEIQVYVKTIRTHPHKDKLQKVCKG